MEDLYFEIEAYLDGELNERESIAFEERMAGDENLKEKVDNLRAVRASMVELWDNEAAENALENALDGIGEVHFSKTSTPPTIEKTLPKKQTLPRLWLLAAAIALLAVAVWFFFPKTEKDLYAQYAELPSAAFTQRSADGAQNLSDAEKAFNSGLYAQALPILLDASKNNPDDAELRFFTALAQMETGSFAQAESRFSTLLGNENAWKDEARWFFALSRLKGGDNASAGATLRTIEPSNRHFGAAQELLEKISK